MNIKLFLFIICFALQSFPAGADENAVTGLDVRIYPKKSKVHFEFCPDNTCDLLSAKKDIPKEMLIDAGYLYLYYFSGYLVLEDWLKDKATTASVQKILKKEQYLECRTVYGKVRASCILKQLKNKYNLKIYFVRYDEGGRFAEPDKDLDDLMKR